MTAPVDGITSAIKTFNKVIDQVLKQPTGPKRWRAAHDLLWLNISPTNGKIYREVAEENRIIRESVDKHGMAIGASKSEKADKTFRNAFNIPVGAYHAITKADPHMFDDKRNFAKFMKEFPEYCTREII